MKLEVIIKLNVLDRAIENLLEKNIQTKEIVTNFKLGTPISAIVALEVWASQLRYNIAIQDIKSVDSLEYQPWSGYKLICGENLYSILEQEAVQFSARKSLPEFYDTEIPEKISKYVYKRIIGEDPIPVSVSIEELWPVIKRVYNIKEEFNPPDLDRLIRAAVKINRIVRMF